MIFCEYYSHVDIDSIDVDSNVVTSIIHTYSQYYNIVFKDYSHRTIVTRK